MTRRRPPVTASAAALCGVALAASLAGCALGRYSPSGVPPGASRDDVLRVMGPPTATYTMPDGHERLEYNRMPAGKQTFMVDLDAGGHMAHWENVLDENHFAAIVAGMRREDVLRLIGPPTFTARYARPAPGITWLYRFETIQRCILFEVSFDVATGQVLDGDYPPDPGCADNAAR
jgi:outer membrane protein assembly factor BamE (lipoprotein component of BamABCDE complex)